MRATAWSGGNVKSPVYGLAISMSDRDALISRAWSSVVLVLGDSEVVAEVQLSDAFWRNCSEFRHPAIRTWFHELGIVPWPKGLPPSFGVRSLGANRFEVRHLERGRSCE